MSTGGDTRRCATQCRSAGWVVSQDERMGVWVGDTVVLTDSGVRRLHRSPVEVLEANVLGG